MLLLIAELIEPPRSNTFTHLHVSKIIEPPPHITSGKNNTNLPRRFNSKTQSYSTRNLGYNRDSKLPKIDRRENICIPT
jgi:hypothetical protein